MTGTTTRLAIRRRWKWAAFALLAMLVYMAPLRLDGQQIGGPQFGGQQRVEQQRDAQQGKTNSVTLTQCRVHLVDEVRLASERSGVLASSPNAGDYVSAGAVVARLSDSVTRAALAIAEKEASNDIEVRFARKAAELTQLKYERTRQANQTLAGTVTDFELRELRLAAQKAILQLEQAEHQLVVAGLRRAEQLATLQTLQVKAPFDAFVRLVHRQPGEFVREGEVIMEIVNTDRVRIEGYIERKDRQRIVRGSKVVVRLTGSTASSSGEFFGHIDFVDVKIEPVSQKIRVTAEVQNRDQLLRDGLTATMTINPQ